MFTFYYFFQTKNDWLAVFKTENTYQVANNKESLIKALSSIGFLIGYDNYQNSDKFLANIISDGKSNFLQTKLSLDLKQEARNCSLEEIGFYMGMDMAAQDPEEFCKKRIAILEKVFDERSEYFETKFEIVKEFKLPSRSIMKTRAGLAAEILKAQRLPNRPNLLFFEYDKRIPLNELPERLVHFYDMIKKQYKNTLDEKLVNEKFKMTIQGLTHTFGVGGVHAAKTKYKGEGTFLLIDIKQFFPSLILNNNFLTKAAKLPDFFENIYQKKVETEKLTYKVLINAVNGSMNNPYSKLYDPRMYYSVTISGQLIITHLLLILETCIEELIQTNTDGILIKINPLLEQLIREIVEIWCQHFNLSVSITKINKIWQRDVNNYIYENEDGELIRKGVYAESTYSSNNIPIVTAGAVLNLVKGIKPQKIIVKEFKTGNLSAFYYVGKIHKGYEKIERQKLRSYKKMNNTICGIATNDLNCGGVYQVKNDLHSMLPGSPNHFLPFTEASLKKLDTEWYVEQIEKNIF